MMNATIESATEGITVEIALDVAFLAVICLGSLVANGFVIFVVSCRESFHKPKYFYYLSLASADLILGAVCLPLAIAAFALHTWPFGSGACQIYGALISVSLNACLATLCIISLERYDTLSKPFESQVGLTFTKRHHNLIIAFSWFHSVFWAGGPLYGWGSVKLDSYTHTCKPDWGAAGAVNKSYSICLAMFAFTLPVLVMVYTHVKIYHIARSYKATFSYSSYGTEGGKRKAVARYAADENDETRSASSRCSLSRLRTSDEEQQTTVAEENKALKTVLLLIGSFAFSWVLYTVVTLWKFSAPDSVPAWIVRAGLVLVLSHCLVNPLIYSILDTKLKCEIQGCFSTFSFFAKSKSEN